MTVTINGAPASAAAGFPSLRRATDRVQLKSVSASGNSYSALAIPGGSYDLYWTATTPGAGVVNNSAAKIKTGIVVGSAPLSLNVDIPATTVSGTVTLDGAPFPKNSRGFILSTSDGDAVSLIVANGAYSTLVVPGTYDITYDMSDSAPPTAGSSFRTTSPGSSKLGWSSATRPFRSIWTSPPPLSAGPSQSMES